MSPHHNETYGNASDYSNHRRPSSQPSPGNQPRLIDLPTPDTGNVNQGIAHPYILSNRSSGSIENYYPTRAPGGNHYAAGHHYQQGHGTGYHQYPQDTLAVPYPPGQTQARDIYPQHGVNAHGTHEPHFYYDTGFNRSASWPPQPINHSAPPLSQYGSASVSQVHNSGRRQVVVPQRPYVPHHRQNYLEQFFPEGPITFPQRTGMDGIPLIDAMNENFDNLIGRDDAMFPSYAGPAISLRLEWTGYKSWTKQIKTKDWRREPKPITKSKLAYEVAKKVRDFMMENASEPMAPGTERWQVGPGFIEVKDLVLFRMTHVSKGSWQAEFRVFE